MNNYITRQGFEKLRQEIEELKKTKQKLSKEISEAAQQGDLRENAGYTAARERMADILRRIGEIDQKLKTANLIDDMEIPKDEVRIGAQVTLKDMESQDTFSYTLVGSDEADPANWKISVHAPLSQAFLGHKVGDKVTVSLPAGQKKYEILKIERPSFTQARLANGEAPLKPSGGA